MQLVSSNPWQTANKERGPQSYNHEELTSANTWMNLEADSSSESSERKVAWFRWFRQWDFRIFKLMRYRRENNLIWRCDEKKFWIPWNRRNVFCFREGHESLGTRRQKCSRQNSKDDPPKIPVPWFFKH